MHDFARLYEFARLHEFVRRAVGPIALALLVSSALSGCVALGVAASAIPQPPVKPKVVLANQRVGVMVWCDRAIAIDWPSVQRDLGGGVQTRLIESRTNKAKELENLVLPWPPESFVRWQKDHPGYEMRPVTEVAAGLQVSRLIYVELTDLSTRSARAGSLFRGSATASIKVIEVPEGATAGKIVFQEDNIAVVYPKHSTEDGRAEGDDMRMYAGTVTELADKISLRFIEHPVEADE